VKFVDFDTLYKIEKHIGPQTKLIYFESPANPSLHIVDIARLAKLAKGFGLKTMIDNTFATPVNQRPITMGVDYVVHSCTKYLGGHSDLLAGAAVGPKKFVDECRERMLMYGPTLGPFQAFLLLRSLKTLHIRIEQQNENALKLAEFFRTHPCVEKVLYPGLSDHPHHEIAKKQMKGFGGIVTIVIKGGKKEAMKVVDNLEVCLNATSLGGVETLVSIPVISSHAWQTDEELKMAGVLPQMIRFSVGIEDIDDIIEDCDQALGKL
jgi:cystathionine beta-lyase/cystathionine gamma-synthase